MADENVNNPELKQKIGSLYLYIAKHLGIKQPPTKVILTKSRKNADKKECGLTGYYDHENKSIRLYITDRADGDILRSFAHEMVHHFQNEHGTLHSDKNRVQSKNDCEPHYAQYDMNLRKMEYYAFLWGSLLYRDFQDEQRYGPPKINNSLPIIT